MSISYNEQEQVFRLNTPDSTYIIGVVDEDKFLGHIYYGSRIEDDDVRYLLRTEEYPFKPSVNNRERLSFLDIFPMEYPTHGTGDYRENCLMIEDVRGQSVVSLSYKSHEIFSGKKKLQGLPATFGSEEECESLDIHLVDKVHGIEVVLTYTVFNSINAITRSVKVINGGTDDVYLIKVLSACLDLDGMNYDVITLPGSWARERQIQRNKVGFGSYTTSSFKGEPGHQEHPFVAIAASDATEDYGEVYGMSFVYSGNFTATVQGTQFENTRAVMGINPVNFKYKLSPGEEFQAPEVVMVFSATGIGGMSRTFHDLYREHLIRSYYKDKMRPVLINNWEATYFDFNTDKILAIAKEASDLGIEMLVLDDGWFGKRNSDNCSLGDWTVNEDKIQGDLKNLVEAINGMGMKFGLWFEPEMVSPDSELYREHPDWAIQTYARTPGMSREQYVLDLSRTEVVEYIYESVSRILKSANIEYVKWDMNRQLADLGSFKLPADRQGELSHRYVLGVYELQERLIHEFPHLLLENCSGGGARFDPGMLYYSPQIWCSDDTDAIERLKIQEGTAVVYPLSTIGAHVSDCPNHTVGRNTPFATRGYVALAGTFGYELDVTKIPEEDRQMIPEQIELYHKYNDLIRTGDYYRLASYACNHQYDAYMIVSKDRMEALVTYIQVLARANYHSRKIRLKGLDKDRVYTIEESGQKLSGAALMNSGILMAICNGDFIGKIIHITSK